MKATFDRTVGILVQAYLNDTLEHVNCHACAVGNIIAHEMGIKIIPCDPQIYFKHHKWETGSPEWYNIGKCRPCREQELTGYTAEELTRIENAFECRDNPELLCGTPCDEWMFIGLMQVVNVLAEIHNVDLSAKESAKALFVKA